MNLTQSIKEKANPKLAKLLQRFFKTGKGQYGEGDIFLGIKVPETRAIAKQFSHLDLKQIKTHLKSKFHEERLAALLILVNNYQKTKDKEIVNFYLKNTQYINNWDLVDLTAHKILGDYIIDKPRNVLYQLAKSNNLWEKRISIIATFAFINKNDLKDSLKLAKFHLKDSHDLMHKAVGWMLRELGKKDQNQLEKFLKQNYSQIPRTTLRYAIERFPEEKRKEYLRGDIK
tara:strand:- start:3142 stop:3831 length:690 start_codon:yes stop_codon:yes gene_type:complete